MHLHIVWTECGVSNGFLVFSTAFIIPIYRCEWGHDVHVWYDYVMHKITFQSINRKCSCISCDVVWWVYWIKSTVFNWSWNVKISTENEWRHICNTKFIEFQRNKQTKKMFFFFFHFMLSFCLSEKLSLIKSSLGFKFQIYMQAWIRCTHV